VARQLPGMGANTSPHHTQPSPPLASASGAAPPPPCRSFPSPITVVQPPWPPAEQRAGRHLAGLGAAAVRQAPRAASIHQLQHCGVLKRVPERRSRAFLKCSQPQRPVWLANTCRGRGRSCGLALHPQRQSHPRSAHPIQVDEAGNGGLRAAVAVAGCDGAAAVALPCSGRETANW
jgi:hypothetical protein